MDLLSSGLPGWLSALLISTLPIIEVRGAIPVAIGIYGMSPLDAYILSVTGNLIPVVPLLLFLGPVSDLLRRHPAGEAFFSWLFSRTRRRYIREHEAFGMLALALFVAIPLPMTGAWTGCAIAFLTAMDFWKAFSAIAIGVMISGLIVTATFIGIDLLIV